LFTARCVAIARIAATQRMRVSAVAPRWKTAPDAMVGSISKFLLRPTPVTRCRLMMLWTAPPPAH